MKGLIIAAVLLAAPASAQVRLFPNVAPQNETERALKEAVAACALNSDIARDGESRSHREYHPGWEHCPEIEDRYATVLAQHEAAAKQAEDDARTAEKSATQGLKESSKALLDQLRRNPQ